VASCASGGRHAATLEFVLRKRKMRLNFTRQFTLGVAPEQ
jgi:hypothetical protein